MATAVFYLADYTPSTLTSIQQTLRSHRARQTPVRWTLEHRLFRSVPSDVSKPSTSPSTATSNPSLPRFQHMLTSSHLGPKTYLFATPAVDTTQTQGAVIAIPMLQKDEFTQLLVGKMAALWAPKAALLLQNGVEFEWGEFVVRVGEVKAAGANPQPRGMVVAVSEIGGEEDEDDSGMGVEVEGKELEEVQKGAEKALRDVWEKLEIKGAKETMGRVVRGKNQKIEAEVRMWCEVLKLRN